MNDRIAEILRAHISTAIKQLELVRLGVIFDGVTDPIPEKEADLLRLIHKWQEDLARHEDRKNTR